MIGVIKRLSVNLPRDALLRIYKSFIRPHLDYRDVTYDKPHNESFKNKIENIQYEVYIAITGAIPFYVNEWCKLDISLRKAKNIKRFKSVLKDFFNLKQKSLFAVHDPAGVKLY